MNWKKLLCIVFLTGAFVTAVIGCDQVESSASAATQTPAVTRSDKIPDQQMPPTGSSNNATRPLMPSGNFTGERPMPPSGNFTGERPSAPVMDLAAAATKLGITESQLSEALGNTQQGMLGLAAAAEKLGITEDALREALGFSANDMMQGGPQQGVPAQSGQ